MELNFSETLIRRLQDFAESTIRILPDFLIALCLLIFFIWFGGLLQRQSLRLMKNREIDTLTTRFLARIARWVLILVGLILALSVLNLNGFARGLFAGAGLSAFIIGFAFKDIGENLLAGVMLAFSRPYRIGDIVEIDGEDGTVVRLNLRNTHLKTFDGRDMFIPNASVIKQKLANRTLDGFLRFDFMLGFDYETDLEAAEKAIVETLKKVPGIYTQRPPFVIVEELGSSTANLRALFWINIEQPGIDPLAIKLNAVNKTLLHLRDEGFELPSDILEIKNYKNKELTFSPSRTP